MEKEINVTLEQLIYDILKAGYQHRENKTPEIPEILGGNYNESNHDNEYDGTRASI